MVEYISQDIGKVPMFERIMCKLGLHLWEPMYGDHLERGRRCHTCHMAEFYE